jgi:hypothetical protein
VSQSLPIGAALDDLELVAYCSEEGEWEGKVVFLPLR